MLHVGIKKSGFRDRKWFCKNRFVEAETKNIDPSVAAQILKCLLSVEILVNINKQEWVSFFYLPSSVFLSIPLSLTIFLSRSLYCYLSQSLSFSFWLFLPRSLSFIFFWISVYVFLFLSCSVSFLVFFCLYISRSLSFLFLLFSLTLCVSHSFSDWLFHRPLFFSTSLILSRHFSLTQSLSLFTFFYLSAFTFLYLTVHLCLSLSVCCLNLSFSLQFTKCNKHLAKFPVMRGGRKGSFCEWGIKNFAATTVTASLTKDDSLRLVLVQQRDYVITTIMCLS